MGGVMTTEQRAALRLLEGRRVGISLSDGSRIDDCDLVSAGRDRLSKIWLFADGSDAFVRGEDIVDVWELPTFRGSTPQRPVFWEPTDRELAAILAEMRPIVTAFAQRDATTLARHAAEATHRTGDHRTDHAA